MARPSNYDLRALMPGVSYDVEDNPEDRPANIINQNPDALDYTIQGLLDKHLQSLYNVGGDEAANLLETNPVGDPGNPRKRKGAR
jgi:hypothetical protein